MLWRRFGVPIAAIVLLFALGRITTVVVDWAWFSSIGYVGVFWTAFATKAALFVVVFAVSTLLLWANATLAYRFALRPRLWLPAAFEPHAAVRALPWPMAGSYRLPLSPLVRRKLKAMPSASVRLRRLVNPKPSRRAVRRASDRHPVLPKT